MLSRSGRIVVCSASAIQAEWTVRRLVFFSLRAAAAAAAADAAAGASIADTIDERFPTAVSAVRLASVCRLRRGGFGLWIRHLTRPCRNFRNFLVVAPPHWFSSPSPPDTLINSGRLFYSGVYRAPSFLSLSLSLSLATTWSLGRCLRSGAETARRRTHRSAVPTRIAAFPSSGRSRGPNRSPALWPIDGFCSLISRAHTYTYTYTHTHTENVRNRVGHGEGKPPTRSVAHPPGQWFKKRPIPSNWSNCRPYISDSFAFFSRSSCYVGIIHDTG